MPIITRTGVGAIICAAHADLMTGIIHGHTYQVTAWYECLDENDAVVLRSNLEMICSAFDHKTLPPALARGEDLAAAILRLAPPSCVEVEVARPLERLYARATVR